MLFGLNLRLNLNVESENVQVAPVQRWGTASRGSCARACARLTCTCARLVCAASVHTCTCARFMCMARVCGSCARLMCTCARLVCTLVCACARLVRTAQRLPAPRCRPRGRRFVCTEPPHRGRSPSCSRSGRTPPAEVPGRGPGVRGRAEARAPSRSGGEAGHRPKQRFPEGAWFSSEDRVPGN